MRLDHLLSMENVSKLKSTNAEYIRSVSSRLIAFHCSILKILKGINALEELHKAIGILNPDMGV